MLPFALALVILGQTSLPNSEWASWGAIVLVIVKMVADELIRRNDLKETLSKAEQARKDKESEAKIAADIRAQDRLDRESDARMIQEKVEASAQLVAEKGQERETRLMSKIEELAPPNTPALPTDIHLTIENKQHD